MDTKNDASNVMLSSNIMLRSQYDRDPYKYLPVDLLPAHYADVRAMQFLSPDQRKQAEKKLFYATRVVDADE